MQVKALIAVFVLSWCAVAARAAEPPADWTSWRGPGAAGSTEKGDYPAQWSDGHILWKAPLPGKGCSTPIVLAGRIYVTAPTDGLDSLIAYDLGGKRLWTAKFGKESPGKHRNGSGSNPSPVTDGKSVFVYFKSGTLAAVGLDGKILWQTNLVERFGPPKLFWDHGTSPVLTDDCVVMARMHNGDSWLAGFDKTTGKLKWKQPRNYQTPLEGDHGYTTPIVLNHKGRQALLVWGGEHLTLHAAADGKLLWSCGNFNPESRRLWPAVASPVVAGDVAIVPFGRNDRGLPRLHGVRLAGEGDVTSTARLWKRKDIGAFVPTPAAHDGKIYLLGDMGRVHCLEPATGKTLWTAAYPKHRMKFYASPLVAGGRLYAARVDGVVFVADVKDGFKLLAENDLGEPVIASPVPAGDLLLIRGTKHLFCIGAR